MPGVLEPITEVGQSQDCWELLAAGIAKKYKLQVQIQTLSQRKVVESDQGLFWPLHAPAQPHTYVPGRHVPCTCIAVHLCAHAAQAHTLHVPKKKSYHSLNMH